MWPHIGPLWEEYHEYYIILHRMHSNIKNITRILHFKHVVINKLIYLKKKKKVLMTAVWMEDNELGYGYHCA